MNSLIHKLTYVHRNMYIETPFDTCIETSIDTTIDTSLHAFTYIVTLVDINMN